MDFKAKRLNTFVTLLCWGDITNLLYYLHCMKTWGHWYHVRKSSSFPQKQALLFLTVPLFSTGFCTDKDKVRSNQINFICRVPYHNKLISGHFMCRAGLDHAPLKQNRKGSILNSHCKLKSNFNPHYRIFQNVRWLLGPFVSLLKK